MTDVLDDFQFTEEGVQDVDSAEEEDEQVCDAQSVVDVGELPIAESDEELDEELDSWEAASFFTEHAVRCATPYSPTKSENSNTSMDVNHMGLDDDEGLEDDIRMDDEDVYMCMDDEDDDYEMEAASYLHIALRLAKIAVAAGIEEVEAAVVDENECVIEPVKITACAPALHRHDDDTCSVHSADSDEEHAAEELPRASDTPGMKMLMSGLSEEEEDETIRARAHQVFKQASSTGRLFAALRQVRSTQMKGAMLPQPSSAPRLLGPAREVLEPVELVGRVQLVELVQTYEPVELVGCVQLVELVQTDEPTKQEEAKDSKISKHSGSRAKSRPTTSTPKSSEATAPATTVRPCSSPAAQKKKHEAASRAEPVEPVIRSLHTSRSRRNVIGAVVRKQTAPCEDLFEKPQTSAAPSSPSSKGLRRHRKHTDMAASFRMDSPAGNKQDEDARESSLTRAYEALGAEMHCLNDADEADVYGSRNTGCAPSTGSRSNSRSSRRTAAVGLGHAPFAAAPDPYAGLRGAPLSAMALDLDGDTKSMVSFTPSRKQTSSSQSRLSSSVGAARVSKSKHSLGQLPSLSASKSTGLLPSLAAKPGYSKHRSQDPLAWSMGDLSSSRRNWGSMSMGSGF